jgi:hypothetical protein
MRAAVLWIRSTARLEWPAHNPPIVAGPNSPEHSLNYVLHRHETEWAIALALGSCGSGPTFNGFRGRKSRCRSELSAQQKSRRMAVLLENFSFFSLQSIRERKANMLIYVYMSGDPSLWLCNCGHASCVACCATFSCCFLRVFCFYTFDLCNCRIGPCLSTAPGPYAATGPLCVCDMLIGALSLPFG